jgi:membrane protein required for colicin V production|tara:strand:- start:827 stop:1381 length:555 start_codon:yes stop_codon:yes gene_type:complete
MAHLDYVIIGLVVISSIIGLTRGLVKEALSLAIWIGGFIAGIVFGPGLAIEYDEYLGGGQFSQIAAFVIVLFAVLIAGQGLQWASGKVIETTGLSATDRLLGFGFGALRGALLVTVMLMLFQSFFSATLFWEESELKYTFLEFEDEILSGIGRFGDEIDQLQDDGQGIDYSDVSIPEDPELYID